MSRYGLSYEGLQRAFPFHFLVDRELQVRQAAPRLTALCPDLVAGCFAPDVLALERPAMAFTFDSIAGSGDLVFTLRSRRRERLTLRGQMLHEPEAGVVAFLGGPWVTEVGQLEELDLTLADFPPHAGSGDLLMLIQAKNTALRDAQTLADKLRRLTEHLQMRNQDLEGEILRTERLASLGRLVAGIAHEINTPLGVAVTAISLVREQLGELSAQFQGGQLKKGDLRRFLDDASQAAGMVESNLARAADLVVSFKRVAVDQTSLERRTIRLADYLGEVVASLAPMLRKTSIEVSIEPAEDIAIETCPGAISQVVTNLVTNAIQHAFGPNEAGRLRFEVGLEDPSTALLLCEDNGRGMGSEELARVFEPFFTTRRGAGGSGLGMHIVHNLVTSVLGGRIAVASEPGAGTRLMIRLPTVWTERLDARRTSELPPVPSSGARSARISELPPPMLGAGARAVRISELPPPPSPISGLSPRAVRITELPPPLSRERAPNKDKEG